MRGRGPSPRAPAGPDQAPPLRSLSGRAGPLSSHAWWGRIRPQTARGPARGPPHSRRGPARALLTLGPGGGGPEGVGGNPLPAPGLPPPEGASTCGGGSGGGSERRRRRAGGGEDRGAGLGRERRARSPSRSPRGPEGRTREGAPCARVSGTVAAAATAAAAARGEGRRRGARAPRAAGATEQRRREGGRQGGTERRRGARREGGGSRRQLPGARARAPPFSSPPLPPALFALVLWAPAPACPPLPRRAPRWRRFVTPARVPHPLRAKRRWGSRAGRRGSLWALSDGCAAGRRGSRGVPRKEPQVLRLSELSPCVSLGLRSLPGWNPGPLRAPLGDTQSVVPTLRRC